MGKFDHYHDEENRPDEIEERTKRLQSCLTLIRRSLGWSATELGDRIGVVRQTINNLESNNTDKYRMSKTQYLAIRSVLDMQIRAFPEKTKLLQSILEMCVDNPDDYEEESKEVVRLDASALRSILEPAPQSLEETVKQITRDYMTQETEEANEEEFEPDASDSDDSGNDAPSEMVQSLFNKVSRLEEESNKNQACMIDAVRILQKSDGAGKTARRVLLQRLLEIDSGADVNATVSSLLRKTRSYRDVHANESPLTDEEKEILKLIGDDGLSVSDEIRQAASAKMEASAVHKCLRSLPRTGYLDAPVFIKIPGSGWCSLYRLSDKGKKAYRVITGKDPEKPEMDRIKETYISLELGYSVRACKIILEKSRRYESVDMYPKKILLPDGVHSYTPCLACRCKADENGIRVMEYYDFLELRQPVEVICKTLIGLSSLPGRSCIITASGEDLVKLQALMAKMNSTDLYKPTPLTDLDTLAECIKQRKPYGAWFVDYISHI